MKFIHANLKNPWVQRLVVYSILAIFVVAITYFVKNPGMRWYYQQNPEILMKEMPFYSLLKEHEPALYEQIKEDIRIALTEESTPTQLKLKVSQYLDSLVAKQVPQASNESVVAYTQVTLSQMKTLQKQGQGLCHQFLYPESGIPIDLAKHLQKDLVEEDTKALTQMLTSSYESPEPTPQVRQVQLYLSHVYTQLAENHSEDINVLANPLDRGVDKKKVCDMTIALFEEILKLPTKQSGETLRYIVFQNQP